MKNELKLISLLFVIICLCSGCDIIYSSTTRDIRHSGFSISSYEFECPFLLEKDGGKDKIKYLLGSSAITNDGKIYKLSYAQHFSNDLNCMFADAPAVSALFDDKVYRSIDGRIYHYLNSGDFTPFSAVETGQDGYSLYYALLGDRDTLKVQSVNDNSYYVLKSDGNVYNVIVDKNNNGVVRVVSSNVVFSKHNYEGNIIDFSYQSGSYSTFVRTENKVFRLVPTNEEKCKKYADIVCDYRMQEDENISKHLDKIIGFSGGMIITSYGKEFNVGGA